MQEAKQCETEGNVEAALACYERMLYVEPDNPLAISKLRQIRGSIQRRRNLMKQQTLMDIGMTKNEAQVYLSLLEMGSAKVVEIANKCKLHIPMFMMPFKS